mgnify:CR=1 FL=1
MWSTKKQPQDEKALASSDNDDNNHGGDDGKKPKAQKLDKTENKFLSKLLASGTATVGLGVAALAFYALTRYKSL